MIYTNGAVSRKGTAARRRFYCKKIKNKPLGRKQILFLVQFAMLLAIEAVFCFTPLGSLPIGPMVATFAMLPVIVAAILLGTGAGTLMGFFAGAFQLPGLDLHAPAHVGHVRLYLHPVLFAR